MIEQDTVKLLRECSAGIDMGVSSIDEVMDFASSPVLRKALWNSRTEHDRLGREVREALHRFHDDGRATNGVAKTMSNLMTDVKLTLHESDNTIASIMTDGCDMGVKSLNRYLNQYKAADEHAKDITKRLIHLEEKLTDEVRDFL